ncbi:MAG: hypothetical protein ACLPTM_12255 [Steroidobacteraceae bacterium]
MNGRAACALVGGALVGAVSSSWATAYVDPTLLDVPWGNYSFIRQGWRGYLETAPAARYRDGLGVVWGKSPPHKSADEIAAALAWAGFRRVRLEVPWGSVRWDETGLDEGSARRTLEILKALKAHGLRPLILLNANHLQPCPVQWRDLVVARAAHAGERTVLVSGEVADLSPPATATVMSLADGTTAGPLITDYSRDADSPAGTHAVRLSKPLTRTIKAQETLRVGILRYPPLYPVGTPQFESTASGWLRYVDLVTRMVRNTYGSDRYDVEIWNELTFGSAYLDINNYREPQAALHAPELLHPGGSAWELASRTVKLLKRVHPQVQAIWGFSNTTFFHVPIRELPPEVDGQSYHPYGTGRRCYADLVRGKRELLLDGYVPDGCAVQPEGYAQAWQQTESLLRFLAPAARSAAPPGTGMFRHFITEHGFSPAEIGITGPHEADQAKGGFLLRAPLFWLNKGLSAMYVYDVYEPEDAGFGVFRSDGGVSPGMAALHRMTAEFSGPGTFAEARQLSLEIAREGPRVGVLPGDPDGEHLPQEQAAAFLPFQLDATKFVIGAYVMTQDFPNPLAPQPYRVTVSGLDGRRVTARYYSPAANVDRPVAIVARSDRSVTLRLSLTELPNLLELEEAPVERREGAG